nr:hypothetical protein [Tanacetum cinerariifolium]
MNRYPSKVDQVLSIIFVDKYAIEQSFIELDFDGNFQVMLNMYEKENEVTIYGHNEDIYQPQGEDDDSDGCPSEGSYHSYIGSDNEDEIMNYERESISDNKNIPTIEVNSRFSNAVVFKRALNHHALMNEFEYFIEKSEPTRFTARCAQLTCRWRIHDDILQDGVTFKVKKLLESHSCIWSNKGGNKCATQGWIASVIKDKLKSDGDVSVTKLKKWLMKHYNVEVPYLRVFRGKEQAYTDMYGKWEDSFIMINAFKEEIHNKNPRSVVDTDFEISGKFNGVLVAATGIDGNNSIFPVAYGVLESENTKSWTWFLNLLKEAIGNAYATCIETLRKNFVATSSTLSCGVLHAIRYLNDSHKKIWSPSKFGTISKCDYITNNISESFNSWIGELRYQPVINLLEAIIERLMNLGDYEICRSNENRAVVKCKGKRDNNWKKYVDGYFTIEKFKEAYAMEISPMLAMDQWLHTRIVEKYTRLLSNARLDDQGRLELRHMMREKKHKCPRCGKLGHYEKRCKNSAPQDSDQYEASTSKRGRGKSAKALQSKKSRTKR